MPAGCAPAQRSVAQHLSASQHRSTAERAPTVLPAPPLFDPPPTPPPARPAPRPGPGQPLQQGSWLHAAGQRRRPHQLRALRTVPAVLLPRAPPAPSARLSKRRPASTRQPLPADSQRVSPSPAGSAVLAVQQGACAVEARAPRRRRRSCRRGAGQAARQSGRLRTGCRSQQSFEVECSSRLQRAWNSRRGWVGEIPLRASVEARAEGGK